MVRSDGYVVLDGAGETGKQSGDGAGETGKPSSKIFNDGVLVHPLYIRRTMSAGKDEDDLFV